MELLLELRKLTAMDKNYIVVAYKDANDRVAEKAILQITGETGCYNHLLKYFISHGGGRIDYTSSQSGNPGHIEMVTIEER